MTISLNRSLTLARKQFGVMPDVGSWFGYVMDSCDPNELKTQAKRVIAKVLRNEYGRFEGWYGEWQYLPLPLLKYVNRDFPFLEFKVDLYLAASITVRLGYYKEQKVEFIKPLKTDIEKFAVPVVLLDAIGAGDLKKLSQFRVMERDYFYITLDIPDFGEVKLRDTLIPHFRHFFKGKKVGQALAEAGLVPLDAASLIDASIVKTSTVPQLLGGDYEDVVNTLKGLGYPAVKAEEAAKYVLEKHGHASIEEKIRHALNYLNS